MKTLTTAQRLMEHLDKEGKAYYREIIKKNEHIKSQSQREEPIYLQAASIASKRVEKSE
ncbi:hypothetical protein [Planomicrobium okeanokoites]|uniref:hypothetical protein n=1 Tax=Planomicrobium okeanokoites TaxID=244 RepID=UPI0015C4C746|nr:hypothetical protein [Planomicrobium okeanokoites]